MLDGRLKQSLKVGLSKSQITSIKRLMNDADAALICDNLGLKYMPFNIW